MAIIGGIPHFQTYPYSILIYYPKLFFSTSFEPGEVRQAEALQGGEEGGGIHGRRHQWMMMWLAMDLLMAINGSINGY